ncbi:MAG: VTC domain-containing protein, partial [Acidimicrobiales bacterium]|nr:VTC domain-containing protein [Acidimicrobiales bacterium]
MTLALPDAAPTDTLFEGRVAVVEPNDGWAGSFDPVGLDELNSIASLQTRVDRKYVICRSDLGELTLQIGSVARVLEIDGRRQFGYWSTYYDTPDLDSYLAAARKRPRRWKVRVRSYLDSDLHYVEVKT